MMGGDTQGLFEMYHLGRGYLSRDMKAVSPGNTLLFPPPGTAGAKALVGQAQHTEEWQGGWNGGARGRMVSNEGGEVVGSVLVEPYLLHEIIPILFTVISLMPGIIIFAEWMDEK